MKKTAKQMKTIRKKPSPRTAKPEPEREYHKCKFCRQSVLFVDGKPYRNTSGDKLAQAFCPGRSEQYCKAIEP